MTTKTKTSDSEVKKIKKCKHEWRQLITTYTIIYSFYCIKCLEIKNL